MWSLNWRTGILESSFLLFFGSLVGFGGSYFTWLFLHEIPSFPNPNADYFFTVLQAALLALSYALSLSFIGFTAITLTYFKKKKMQLSSAAPKNQGKDHSESAIRAYKI